jgi:hypothetical protein
MKLRTTMNFGGKLSFIVSFLFHERLHCCYIHFTALNCATTIIGLEPCALNAEYQHFIRRFIKMSFYFADTTERGGERRPKDRVKTRVTLLYYILGKLLMLILIIELV